MNSGKCRLFASGKKCEYIWTKKGNSKCKLGTAKLLGITIDSKFKLDEHIGNFCMMTQRKLKVLITIRKYLDFKKLKILFKIFFESQFKFCLLTWMFHSTNTTSQINKLQESFFRLVQDGDYTSVSEELREKDKSFIVYYYNIQALCIELYEVYNNLSQTIFSDLFIRNQIIYNSCSQSNFAILQIKLFMKVLTHFDTWELLSGI